MHAPDASQHAHIWGLPASRVGRRETTDIMHDLDATFEEVSERQAFLRQLASPQPSMPLNYPPRHPVSRLIQRLMARLGELHATSPAPVTDPQVPDP